MLDYERMAVQVDPSFVKLNYTMAERPGPGHYVVCSSLSETNHWGEVDSRKIPGKCYPASERVQANLCSPLISVLFLTPSTSIVFLKKSGAIHLGRSF